MTRTLADLTQDERKRIVAGWRQVDGEGSYWGSLRVIGACLDIHEDTVRQVLREEGE